MKGRANDQKGSEIAKAKEGKSKAGALERKEVHSKTIEGKNH